MITRTNLLLFSVFCQLNLNFVGTSKISIATCNLWNVMFNWETRIRRIVDLVREQDLDIIVFQEVRINGLANRNEASNTSSQLNEFRYFLPEYRWIQASSAGKVSRVKNSYKEEWGFEGLGVISRREIVFSRKVELKQTSFQDLNKRIALHIRLKLDSQEQDLVDVIVVHFSYDAQQQCQNANDVIKIIDDGTLKNVIILGDFNAYKERTPSLDLFLKKDIFDCPIFNSKVIGSFKDVWLDAGRGHELGLTFSNMPSPGLQSRPDRILVSKNFQVEEIDVMGDGNQYKNKYYISILLSRVNAVLKTSYQAFSNYHGYSCLQDCGPHGSCRCGVCVTGGDKNNCDVPSCSECNSHTFLLFVTFLIPTFLVGFVFLLALIRILVISARFSQKDIQEILGYRCCLFNRQLFHTRVLPRRFRINISNFFQLYHLPPVWVILGCGVFLVLLLSVFKFCFKDSLETIFSILAEEYFPSDHKIVYAQLRL